MAQGAIPVCPKNPAYDGLGLPEEVFYEQGSSDALAERLHILVTLPDDERQAIRHRLSDLARAFTIESMHESRRRWISSLLAKETGPPALA